MGMRGGKERCRLAPGQHLMLQSTPCRLFKGCVQAWCLFFLQEKSLQGLGFVFIPCPWFEHAGSPDGGALVGAVAKNVGAKRLVVAWWGDKDISILARSLAAFSPRGSRISVIAQDKPEVRLSRQPVKAGQSCPGRKTKSWWQTQDAYCRQCRALSTILCHPPW